MYKPRTIEGKVARVSAAFKVLMLTGMRQVGKTTLLRKQASQKRHYVTLDNPKDLLLAKTEPDFFFQTYPPPVFIDEIQYAPELFPHIKMLVDASERNGSVWLTGSQQFLLMKGVSESLAGRMALLDLLGFSIYERDGLGELQKPFLPSPTPASALKHRDLRATFEIIWKGSFPGVIGLGNDEWATFFGSYVRTYLERDVRQLSKVGDELAFLRFLKVLAARTGQELNLADIARNVEVAPNTAKNWLSILETSGVVYLLQPYFNNPAKRLIKAPKLYFCDTGLCAFLAEWNTPQTLAAGAMSGAFFETFVVTEIIKSHWHSGKKPSLYFYRDNQQVEIDLLIAQDGTLHPVEIKKTGNPTREMVKNFDLRIPGQTMGYGSLICLTDKPRPLTAQANAISIWDI